MAVLLGFFYQGLPLANGINAMHSGFNAQIILDMHPEIDAEAISASGVLTLLNRGGISAMVDAFIITFICMYFAGILEYIGLMDVLVHRVFGFVKGTGSLIVVSGIICILLAGTAGSTAVILIGGPDAAAKVQGDGPAYAEPVQNARGLRHRLHRLLSLDLIWNSIRLRSGG